MGMGILKKTKKRKKSYKMTKKRGKKEKKEEKLKKMMQKDVQNCMPDTETSFNVKIGKILRGKIPVSK
jgi:hypothetical protein